MRHGVVAAGKQLADAETFCPACDGILDVYGDRALVCPCRGDRVKRHNALRDQVFFAAPQTSHCPPGHSSLFQLATGQRGQVLGLLGPDGPRVGRVRRSGQC